MRSSKPAAASRDLPLHDSAWRHVQGRARYIDDLPRLEGEVVVLPVGAPCARGRIVEVDLVEAGRVPGVVGVWGHEAIPGSNRFGPIFEDEPFLIDGEISYLRQPVAVVAAETLGAAWRARAAVRIEVESEEPILEIEQARHRDSFIGAERRIEQGDVERAWARASRRIDGVFHSKGQEQFYLESQAALAIPAEDGRSMELHSSTQNPTEIQKATAELLGWRHNQVVCTVQRMGGAFGGKETQAALPAAFAALAAHHTGRPARIVYDRDDDMRLTGKRHEMRTEYSVGYDDEGHIEVAEIRLFSNGGAFADLSTAVLERAMLHVDNAYHLSDVRIRGRVCRTNLPPNTAFRGFGGPQGMAVIENVMEEIAIELGLDALDIRRRNVYSDRESSPRSMTPYGQRVTNNLLPEIFSRLEESSGYRHRREEIAAGSNDPVTLRGLAMVPVKFGISFTNKTLNQANALVNVYTDGTVQLSTGATEMGQGVNVKLAQIVGEELGISWRQVEVMATSTEKNNNTSPTAASASTDLNGSAAVVACRKIRHRLAELASDLFTDPELGVVRSPDHVRFAGGAVFDERMPDRKRIGFAELARRAHTERVDLGARGFYATPGVDFNRETGKGTPFAYYTTGCCVAEVALDRLLGLLRVERLDVLMDIGKPIHLDIELGQIIGGLIQGIGWVTAEELVYDDGGDLLSRSPTTYKIPAVTDLPPVFHVDLIDNDLNRRNLRSTKAVGEPPLMLGLAVWCAAKDALSRAPGDGRRVVPELTLPATHEVLALACDRLAHLDSEETAGTETAEVEGVRQE